jgi:hypothetical protein
MATSKAAAAAKTLSMIGLPVAYWPRAADADNDEVAPRPATVAEVTDDTAGHVLVNLSFLSASGAWHAATDVPLYETGDRPLTSYAEFPGTVGKSGKRGAKADTNGKK